MALDFACVEKREVIPDSAALKSDFLVFYQTTIGGPELRRENLSQMGFVTCFMNGAPQKIVIK